MLVDLCYPSLYCRTGSNWEALWKAMQEQPVPTAWPFSGSEELKISGAYLAPDPSIAAFGIDRKLARTMEKQARLAVCAAGLTLQQWGERSPAVFARTGLYLGMPTIDEEVPPLSAFQRRHESRGKEDWLAILHSETPPFSGLSMLNSSACAHIASTFGLRGALAAFSSFSDAGLEALIEGVLSVAEEENERALIGAVGPKLHPLLPVQYAHLNWPPDAEESILGEGSAFVLARVAEEAGAAGREPVVRLTGYARGFVLSTAVDSATAVARILTRAVTMSGCRRHDIGWILPAVPLSPHAAAVQSKALCDVFSRTPDELPVAYVERAIGILGPAQSLIHVGLAATGLAARRRLVWRARQRRHQEDTLNLHAILLLAWAPHGQCVAAVLERGGA